VSRTLLVHVRPSDEGVDSERYKEQAADPGDCAFGDAAREHASPKNRKARAERMADDAPKGHTHPVLQGVRGEG
jgi:hypothetical protein